MKVLALLMVLSTSVFAGKQKYVHITDKFDWAFSTSTATSAAQYSLGTLPVGAIVKNAYMTMSSVISPSAMTIGLSNSTGVSGLMGPFTSSALVTGSVYRINSIAGSNEIWDDSADEVTPYRVNDTDGDNVLVKFSDDPTQGAFSVYIEYILEDVPD